MGDNRTVAPEDRSEPASVTINKCPRGTVLPEPQLAQKVKLKALSNKIRMWHAMRSIGSWRLWAQTCGHPPAFASPG